jgi:hypothetical protein
MTSLNKSIANSPDEHTLSMFDYWKILESSVYTQQAETGSYDPIKLVIYKETTPISGNLTFQVSPGSRFAVNDLHNSYSRLEVERTFLNIKSYGGAINAQIFLGDKHSANFMKQFRICCNDMTITENLDFVYETNILGAIISDATKFNKPEIFTAAGSLSSGERSVCGKYMSLNLVNPNNSITVKYSINIPMTTFNLFEKMRYLPTFFGNWTLDIIPTLDNMIVKVINIGGVAITQCNHIRRSASFQCYGVEIIVIIQLMVQIL